MQLVGKHHQDPLDGYVIRHLHLETLVTRRVPHFQVDVAHGRPILHNPPRTSRGICGETHVRHRAHLLRPTAAICGTAPELERREHSIDRDGHDHRDLYRFCHSATLRTLADPTVTTAWPSVTLDHGE